MEVVVEVVVVIEDEGVVAGRKDRGQTTAAPIEATKPFKYSNIIETACLYSFTANQDAGAKILEMHFHSLTLPPVSISDDALRARLCCDLVSIKSL